MILDLGPTYAMVYIRTSEKCYSRGIIPPTTSPTAATEIVFLVHLKKDQTLQRRGENTNRLSFGGRKRHRNHIPHSPPVDQSPAIASRLNNPTNFELPHSSSCLSPSPLSPDSRSLLCKCFLQLRYFCFISVHILGTKDSNVQRHQR